ncbi:MAG: alpha/beta fold hydrolase [Alicyclobacillus sp.]|nr:alpha/beta fold hydrolase [Alicyclobacillus sp.]
MQRAVELCCRGRVLRGMEHVPDCPEERWPWLILLHSFGATKVESHRLYVRLSRRLELRGVASVRFDFSGSGESDGEFAEMTVSGELAEAHAILDYVRSHPRVDAARVSVAGFSLGGLVAGMLAGDRPDDVARLALVAPAANLPELVRDMAAAAGLAEPPEVFDYEGDLLGRAFALDVLQLQPWQRSQPYQGPVLLVHGSADTRVPPAVTEAYQAKVYGGRAQVVWVDGADHTFNRYAWQEQVIDAVVGFVAPQKKEETS